MFAQLSAAGPSGSLGGFCAEWKGSRVDREIHDFIARFRDADIGPRSRSEIGRECGPRTPVHKSQSWHQSTPTCYYLMKILPVVTD